MRYANFVLFTICLLAFTGCGSVEKTNVSGQVEAPGTVVETTERIPLAMNDMQIGLNFIRFYFSTDVNDRSVKLNRDVLFTQPGAIFKDLQDLGAQVYRQNVKADLTWDEIEPTQDAWNFEAADEVLMNSPIEPIVTLFDMQYGSPNPPWIKASDPFLKTLGTDAIDYITTVTKRYGPYVKYWEIGNEMDHWRSFEDDAKTPLAEEGSDSNKPSLTPLNAVEFTPEEQGKFFAEVSAIIRANDPDAVILMPGMSAITEYHLSEWLPGVLAGGGTDWFDVVNYHYYDDWDLFPKNRIKFSGKLKEYEIDDKPVWLTESGVTSNADLTIRTDYPNSKKSQAADVFRRAIESYAYGDSFFAWHTYIGSGENNNNWSAYGLVTINGQRKDAYYTFKLLTDELIPFESVSRISGDDIKAENVFEILMRSGETKYVAWGNGSYEIPAGMSKMTSVIPNSNSSFDWKNVSPGDEITLSEMPVLVK